MSQSPTLSFRIRPDGVAVVSCKARGVLCATLSPSFFDDFQRTLDELEKNASVKAIILSFGPRPWTSGSTLNILEALKTSAQAEALCRRGHPLAARIARPRKPIVAEVQGPLLSDGLALALACQGRVASDDAETLMGFPELRLGLVPVLHGLQRLAEKGGLKAALDFGLTGETLSVSTAKALGIVDEVGPPSELEERCANLAMRLTNRPENPKREAWREVLDRAASARNPLHRALLFREAQKRLLGKHRAHYPAPARALDVLRAFFNKALDASKDVEALVFGELVVSETTQRLVEIFADGSLPRLPSDPAPITPRVELVRTADALAAFARKYAENAVIVAIQEAPDAYSTRVLRPYLSEAARLLNEGVPRESVDEALIAWGWSVGAVALLSSMSPPLAERFVPNSARKELGGAAERGLRATAEESQMRCCLAFVNEAVLCLAEGVLSSPREGDLGAVLGLGFPAFRGGPFRYLDAVGAPETVRRLEALRARFGPRFTPAPLLREMANDGRRFYE